VADECPVHEVGALVDGNAGPMREGGVDQVVLVADAFHGRVGVVTSEDGIVVAALRQRRAESRVTAGVFEPFVRDVLAREGGQGRERGQQYDGFQQSPSMWINRPRVPRACAV